MEEAAQDFARQHPDVVLYVSPHKGPGPAPVLRAEYCECWGFGEGTGASLPCPGSVPSPLYHLCPAQTVPGQLLWEGGAAGWGDPGLGLTPSLCCSERDGAGGAHRQQDK